MKTMNKTAFHPLFFRLKWKIANNHLSDLRRHKWVHFAVGMLVLVMLIAGGTAMFNIVFRFLMNQEPFGPPLMDRLIKMVLLAFFSMLIFSNLIIMLTTTFISREVEFLMSQPLSHRKLFFAKLGESLVYSSWAFVILSIPFFCSLAHTRHLDWSFFAGAVALVVPYLIIPAAIGALLVLILTGFFPPRRMIRFSLALAAVGIALAVAMQRFYGLGHFLRGEDSKDLVQMMQFMGVGDILVLPSGWLGRGLHALELHAWGEAGFWALALWSTAAMGLVVCDWLAGPLYYRGWALSRTSGSANRTRRHDLYGWFDRALGWMPPATRAMVSKDLTIFWRDPAQWGQLMILFGLLFIYFINLRSAAGAGQLQIFIPFWQSLISLFNIGATGFVLSILTTRFVYPMLSLEGKQQWVIGLAPLARTRLVWVKFVVSCLASFVLTVPLAFLSCAMLKTDAVITALAITTVLFLSLGLSALAVGLGALLPNFAEDNPSRIANGVGGTLSAVISLVYIGVTLALEAPLVNAYVTHGLPQDELGRALLYASIPLWLLVQAAMTAVPLALGLRQWRRIEF